MKPIALVPVAILFAGTAAFAATTSTPHSTGSAKPAAASPAASTDDGNSAAAHSCPKGPHGVHGKCVSAAAHARNAARHHGKGDQNEASETPEADEQGSTPAAHPAAPQHPTPPPHPTP